MTRDRPQCIIYWLREEQTHLYAARPEEIAEIWSSFGGGFVLQKSVVFVLTVQITILSHAYLWHPFFFYI